MYSNHHHFLGKAVGCCLKGENGYCAFFKGLYCHSGTPKAALHDPTKQIFFHSGVLRNTYLSLYLKTLFSVSLRPHSTNHRSSDWPTSLMPVRVSAKHRPRCLNHGPPLCHRKVTRSSCKISSLQASGRSCAVLRTVLRCLWFGIQGFLYHMII